MSRRVIGEACVPTGRTACGQRTYGEASGGDDPFLAQRLWGDEGVPNDDIAQPALLRKKSTGSDVSTGQTIFNSGHGSRGSGEPAGTTSTGAPSEHPSELHSEHDDLDLRGLHDGGPCTALLKNIPYQSTQEFVAETLDGFGLRGTYDMVYIPRNPTRKTNLGYAFVNFLHREHFQECYRFFHNKPFGGSPPTKLCTVQVSSSQGIKGPKTCVSSRAGKHYGCPPLVVADRPPPGSLAAPAALGDALARFGTPVVTGEGSPPPPPPPLPDPRVPSTEGGRVAAASPPAAGCDDVHDSV